jgi:hypothetical protein
MTFAPTSRVRPAPLPGEALDSWLEAVACRMPVPLGDVLGDLALGPRNENGSSGLATLAGFTTALPDEEPARTAYASGVAAVILPGR